MGSTKDDRDFAALTQAIELRTGIRFRDDQLASTRLTINRVMDQFGIEELSGILAAFSDNVDVYQSVVEAITIGETYFFREPKHFDFIKQQLIPEFQDRRGKLQTLRAWSAGCASGAEAYSLAIVCDQLTQPTNIIATDIAPSEIAAARRAIYRDWAFRGEAMSRAKPYIVRNQDEWEVVQKIRRRVRFRLLNFVSDDYPDSRTGLADFDIIFCRNVLIYFQHDVIHRIAERLFQCLAPGGWLITASGDPSLIGLGTLETMTTKHGTFYRRPLKHLIGPQISVRAEPTAESDDVVGRETQTSVESAAKADHSSRSPDGSILEADAASRSVDVARTMVSARAAMDSGDYATAIQLTGAVLNHIDACLINVLATARLDLSAAIEKCVAAIRHHPLSCELQFLHGRLLWDMNQPAQALKSVQKALFLDRSVVMVHFLLGTIQIHRGQLDSAKRHLQIALRLCQQMQPSDSVPLSEGKSAREIAAATELQLERTEISQGQR